MNKNKSWLDKDTMIKGAKIALGSSVAIAICMLLGLENSASAGIITLLTIQNTTRDTLNLAKFRFISFVFAMLIAYAINSVYGYRTAGFCIYILITVVLSSALGWENTISTNAVFGTHIFISGEHFSFMFLVNEFLILLIGTAIAVILNLRMPRIEKEIKNDIDFVEHTIMLILYEISEKIRNNKDFENTGERFPQLMEHLDDAINKALINRGNTLREHSEFYINFFILRKNQVHILMDIYDSLRRIDCSAANTEHIADFFKDISDGFSIGNTAHPKLNELNILMERFKNEKLPKNYDDFSVKATLFHCLKEIGDFFMLKQQFIDNLSEEQISIYLKIH